MINDVQCLFNSLALVEWWLCWLNRPTIFVGLRILNGGMESHFKKLILPRRWLDGDQLRRFQEHIYLRWAMSARTTTTTLVLSHAQRRVATANCGIPEINLCRSWIIWSLLKQNVCFIMLRCFVCLLRGYDAFKHLKQLGIGWDALVDRSADSQTEKSTKPDRSLNQWCINLPSLAVESV